MLYVQYVAMAIGLWAILYLEVIVHELGHALIQIIFGDTIDTISIGAPTRHTWIIFGVTIKVGWPFICGYSQGTNFNPRWKEIIIFAAGPLAGMLPLYLVLGYYEGLNAIIEVHTRLLGFYLLRIPPIPRGEPVLEFFFHYMLGTVQSPYQIIRLFVVTSWTYNVMGLLISLPGTDCRYILNLALKNAKLRTKLLVNSIAILLMIGPSAYHLYLIYLHLSR